MGRVAGKVALVTGAARGQGRSHARRLAEEGADIIAIDVCHDVETVDYAGSSPQELEETVQQVEALDRRILARQVDTRDFAGVERAVQDGVAEFGHIDIVVANAGILTMARSWEITDEQWNTMLDVNLKGTWHAAKAAVPIMIEQGHGGSIIMISSIAGLGPLTGMAHYGAAKHGVTGLARTMANELAEYNIRVNSVHPTSVHTPMIDNETLYKAFRPDLENPTLEDAKAGFASLNKLPIPWVEPVDVSNAVLYLASDEARYVTGVQLPVDAGWTQR